MEGRSVNSRGGTKYPKLQGTARGDDQDFVEKNGGGTYGGEYCAYITCIYLGKMGLKIFQKGDDSKMKELLEKQG